MSTRLAGRFGYHAEDPFRLTVHHDKLKQAAPLRWRKPRRIFVCSMGDLFHEETPHHILEHIFWMIEACRYQRKDHIFQILTKRPERALEFIETWLAERQQIGMEPDLSNIHLYVSAENQYWLDHRAGILLQIPSVGKRGVSLEPLLDEIDLSGYGSLDHVIVGGESGPGARPMHPDWARKIRDQCISKSIPFFFKQWGCYKPDPSKRRVARPDSAGELLDWESGAGKKKTVTWVAYGRTGRASELKYYRHNEAGRELDGTVHSELPE